MRTNRLSHLSRLDELLGLLKSTDYITIRNLAEQLQISRRTVLRDLNILRDRGILIESDVGRGGGLRLPGGWGMGRLAISYPEAIHLLLSLAIVEKLGSPLSISHLRQVRQKIAVAFPESQRREILSLKKRILLGSPASEKVLQNYAQKKPSMHPMIERAFFEKRFLQITYQNEQSEISQRLVEPQFLLINWPVWYLMGWDERKNDVRIFRLDRLKAVHIKDSYFRPRPASLFLEKIEFLAEPL